MNDNGLRLLILNTQEPNWNPHLTGGVADAFRAVLGREHVQVARYADAVRTFRRTGCNSLLLLDGQGMRVPIVKELLSLSSVRILWTMEDPYELSVNLRHAEWVDHVFTNDSGSVADYGDKGNHMPLAAAAVVDRPLPLTEQDIDVFFAGVAWPNRVKIIRDLLPKLAGCRVQVFLPKNPGVPRPELPIPEFQWNVRLAHRDLLAIARRSKVVLYLDRDFSTSGSRTRAASPANRLFEIAALGVPQIAIGDARTIQPYLEPEKEVIVASQAAEAAEKIRGLLGNPERMRAIGEAARMRVLSEHTYVHRARAIVQKVGSTRGSAHKATPAHKQPLRVLMVLHNVRGQQFWGGTEFYADLIQRGLHDEFHFHLLYSRPEVLARSIVHRDCRTGIERVLFTGAYDPYRDWIDPGCDLAFQRLLQEEGIHLVHFVHLLLHSFGYVHVARALGRPAILDLHDYFLACPRFNLLDAAGQYCDLPPLEKCDECLGACASLPVSAQEKRRAMMCKVLDAVDRIRFVSQSERSLVERVLPVPKGKAVVRGVGIPHSVAPGEPDPPPPLRVIVIGNVARNKGADVLLGLAGRLASEPIELEFAGAIQPEYVEPLRQLSQAGVTVRGSYEPEDVGQILKGHHVALFASSWPETFVITLSEAFRAGVVPVVPNIGAFAERVRDGENGLVVRGDSASYLCALLSLLNDPELLERLRSGALATRPPTLEDSLSLMRNAYRALAAEYDVAASVKPTPWEADSSLAIPISDIRAGPEEPPCTTPAVLQRVLRVYRLAGVRGVARRVWTKIRSGRRSA